MTELRFSFRATDHDIVIFGFDADQRHVLRFVAIGRQQPSLSRLLSWYREPMMSRREISRMMNLAWLAIIVVVASGCGTPCAQIASHRQAFLERSVEQAPTPHAVAVIPLSMANELIEPQVREMSSFPIQVPGAGVLGPYLRDLSVQPRAARLVPAQGEGIGLAVDLDVMQGEALLFSLAVGGVIQPTFDSETRRVIVELRPGDFTSMRPTLAPDAITRLSRALERVIPSFARLLLPGPVIAAGAALVGEIVLTQSYPMIRDQLLGGLGPLARLDVTLPELPIERIATSTRPGTEGGTLRLDLYTTLPIAHGVVGDVESGDTSAQQAMLLLSGETVAEVANWAMADGQLPSRFDEHGRASDSGEYRVALQWTTGNRPLRVHVWRLDDQCLRATLASAPLLSVAENRLQLEIEEVHVEELEGPPWAGLARLFSRVWLRAIERTQSTAAALEFSVGGRQIRGRITSVERQGDRLQLLVALDN